MKKLVIILAVFSFVACKDKTPIYHELPPARAMPIMMQRIYGGTVIKDFSISIFPVTQSQYYQVMNITVEQQKELARAQFVGVSYGEGVNHPMYYVSWYEAIVFCNALSIQEGLEPVYSIADSTNPEEWGPVPRLNNSQWDAVTQNNEAGGYRLPTQAEWEYACRAGTTTAFNTGDSITFLQANFSGYNNDLGKTTECGTYAPNNWGLYDMHGNVWEWCWDPEPATFEHLINSGRIARGGAFNSMISRTQSDFSNSFSSFFRDFNIGFRIARNESD
jgi:formylglycine-generating enzyme required for sulfatase activity